MRADLPRGDRRGRRALCDGPPCPPRAAARESPGRRTRRRKISPGGGRGGLNWAWPAAPAPALTEPAPALDAPAQGARLTRVVTRSLLGAGAAILLIKTV